MTDTNSIFYRIGQSVKSTMNSQLDDYVPFSGAQSIDLTGSGNFGSLSVSGVPVVTGSIDTSNFALANHDHDTDYASISHNHYLGELNDVVAPAPGIDGQVLQWDGTMWTPQDPESLQGVASADHVHSEYLDDSDLNAYSVTASAEVNGSAPPTAAGLGGEYYTAMTADNQFIAISYTDDAGNGDGSTVGKVDIFKRNSDGTLGDRFSVDLSLTSTALPIAIAKLNEADSFDMDEANSNPPGAADGGLMLYAALSYSGTATQLAKAYYIPLFGGLPQSGNLFHVADINSPNASSDQAHSISTTEDGRKIALGCEFSDSNPDGMKYGRVFVFQLHTKPTAFSEIRNYLGSTPDGGFGNSLSYRGDGELLAVGAPGNPTTAGAVIVINDSDANYNTVSATIPAGESFYERQFSSAIFSSALSWQDYPESSTFNFIEITDLPVNNLFGTPVLKFDGTETHLSIVTANQGRVYSFTDHGTGSWTGKGAPFASTVDGSNAYSIDSSENGRTIVVAYSALSSMSEFDFTGHQIKRFVHNPTTNSWDSGTIVANISDAGVSYNKFKSVLIASDGSFITTAMSYNIASGGAAGGLFRVYEHQNVYATREHTHALSALSDINHLNLSGGVPTYDKSMLIWDAFSGKWAATPHFLGNKNLNDLSDVGGYTNASLTGGEVLQWSPANNQFEPATIAGADYSNGIQVDQFVATPLLSLRSQDMANSLGSISAEESTQAGVGATVKIAAFGGTVSIGDAGTAGGECDLSVTNNLTVGGNLTVNGTATTVNTTNLDVEDSIIKLNLNGGGNFVAGGIGGSSGIEIEAGVSAADGGNDRKARFVYNSGEDPSLAEYGTDLGFFEAIYEQSDGQVPPGVTSGHLKMKVKSLEVENGVDPASGFDNLGNYEDFLAGLNA